MTNNQTIIKVITLNLDILNNNILYPKSFSKNEFGRKLDLTYDIETVLSKLAITVE